MLEKLLADAGPQRTATPPNRRRATLPEKVKIIVWARAAGRCQYAGCNKLLIGDDISNTPNANKAYICHIVSDDPGGPRGDAVLSPKLAKDAANLMLACDIHHRVFDREREADHPRELLLEMKRRHEDRIRITTETGDHGASHVLRYAAKIGSNESPVEAGIIKSALLPERFAVDGGIIDLDLPDLELRDDQGEYWRFHIKHLRDRYAERVRGRMERQEIQRISVFALAPIPLLIELGRLLSDISIVEVRQLLRHPKGWRWQDGEPPMNLDVKRPTTVGKGPIALKLAISAPIIDERVTSVLGPEAAIWSIEAINPHNDILRSQADLARFAQAFRTLLDDIKVAHGEQAVVNVFPAIPVSAAVEVGRSWQPKAHPSLRIFDENRVVGGFHHVHDLVHGEGRAR